MKVTIAPDFRDLFRPLTEDEFNQAQANNLDDPDHERVPPVVVWDGLIIDGHHTYKIRSSLRLNGKPVKIRYHKMDFYDRDEAMAYAIKAQLGRRNLNASQIAMALAKLPKSKRGPEIVSHEFVRNSESSREQLAHEAGIGTTTMTAADKVHEQGAKVLQDAVTSGDVSVSDAASVVSLPKSEQAAALKKVKSGKAKTLRKAVATDPKTLAQKNKALAHSYRDKLARAICDYHEVKQNRAERDRLVKLVQGIVLW